MSNIKILDVFGQFRVGAGADAFSSGSAHQFIFPRNWEVEGDWKIYINDVRSILNDIPKCYASWCNNEGWWIAAIVKNEYDARQGYAVISACLGDKLPTYGLLAIRMLDSLANTFMNQEKWNLGELRTEETIKQISNDIELANSTLIKSDYSQPSAVRRYKSEKELHELFENLAQPYHKRFSRVIYVADNVASSLTPNSYKDVTNEPLSVGYEIKCAAADGKVSATKAMKGDKISLTFKNITEMPVTVTFIAGEKTPYATYDDNLITIKKHNILRLIPEESFFNIKCVNEAGQELTGWTATPRTSTVALAIDENKCLYPQGSDKQIQIGISLQGYHPATIDVKLPELPSDHTEVVTLKRYAATPTTGNKPNSNDDNKIPSGALPKIITAIAIMAILIVGGIVAWVLTSGNDEANENTEVIAATTPEDDKATEAFNNDLNIFKINSQNINKKDLQSEEFKTLIDYIATGNTTQILDQMEKCYGNIHGNNDINPNLREIYNNLTKLINAGDDTKVGRFASLCIKSSHYNDPSVGTDINLNKLNKGLKDIINPPKVIESRPEPRHDARPEPNLGRTIKTKKGKTTPSKTGTNKTSSNNHHSNSSRSNSSSGSGYSGGSKFK